MDRSPPDSEASSTYSRVLSVVVVLAAVLTGWLFIENRALRQASTAIPAGEDFLAEAGLPGSVVDAGDSLRAVPQEAITLNGGISLEAQLEFNRAEIARLEAELAALSESVDPAYESVKDAAEAAAREEFFAEHTFFASVIRQQALADSPPSDTEIRTAQATVMSNIVIHLRNMGISGERINAMMDTLVQRQFEQDRRSRLLILGELTREELLATDPTNALQEFLTPDELVTLRELQQQENERRREALRN